MQKSTRACFGNRAWAGSLKMRRRIFAISNRRRWAPDGAMRKYNYFSPPSICPDVLQSFGQKIPILRAGKFSYSQRASNERINSSAKLPPTAFCRTFIKPFSRQIIPKIIRFPLLRGERIENPFQPVSAAQAPILNRGRQRKIRLLPKGVCAAKITVIHSVRGLI